MTEISNVYYSIGFGNENQAAHVLARTMQLAIYCSIDFQFGAIDLTLVRFWPFCRLRIVTRVLHLN